MGDIKKISCSDTEEALRQGKINRDNIDDADKRNLVGSLLINVADNNLKKDLGVEDDRSYDEINVDCLTRALSDRYKVDLRTDDFIAAKRISRSGTIKVAFKDTKPGSRYKQLVNAIKSKGANKKGEFLYANFALTARRNNLLYTLREAWREKKIEKYFVDYDGAISVVPSNMTKKLKITSVVNKDTNCTMWTMSKEELVHQIANNFADYFRN